MPPTTFFHFKDQSFLNGNFNLYPFISKQIFILFINHLKGVYDLNINAIDSKLQCMFYF